MRIKSQRIFMYTNTTYKINLMFNWKDRHFRREKIWYSGWASLRDEHHNIVTNDYGWQKLLYTVNIFLISSILNYCIVYCKQCFYRSKMYIKIYIFSSVIVTMTKKLLTKQWNESVLNYNNRSFVSYFNIRVKAIKKRYM